jgi:hypothetical protein
MLLELLAAIESHKGSAVADVMRRLEGGIKTLMQDDQEAPAETAEAHPAPAPEAETAAEPEPKAEAVAEIAAPAREPQATPATLRAPARGRILSVVATPAKMAETSGQLALAAEPESEEMLAEAAEVDDEFEDAAGAAAESEPESVADIAMKEAGDIVAEPDEDAAEAKAEGEANPQEQELVNALLEAEKRLIDAEALAGAANANSPVAEIIRRISQRTREIAPQA